MLLVNNKEQLRNKEKQLDINNPKKDAICTLKISQIIGMKKGGTPIIGINEIKKLYGKDIQIVTASLFYSEIIKDLKKIGFNTLFEPMYFSTLYSDDFDVLIWKNDIKKIINNKKQISNKLQSTKLKIQTSHQPSLNDNR